MTVGRALDPVRAMTATGGRVERARPRPNASAPTTPRPDELGELARTFDALLDRVAASLRHEQRLSAELSHELRTPLARIVAEIELLHGASARPRIAATAYAVVSRSADR